jgi:hypothetical protein
MLGSFTIHLAQSIDLASTENWDIGVCELTYHPNQTGTFRSVAIIGKTNPLIN